ncbi:Uncharacterized protein conserved in bacteria [Mycobacteroides abscessus subsp. abscessus]|nr:Uncharacterized protein conserved in bacteria [Mycobacteroides abscessus subsp. abscessus]
MTARHHQMIAEFTTTFGHPLHDTPTRPGPKLQKLRIRLLREEFNEFTAAVMAEDYTEVADGLGDMAVIAHGTLHAYGLPYAPRSVAGPSNLHTAYLRYLDAEKAAAANPSVAALKPIAYELNQLLVDIRHTAAQLRIPFGRVFEEIHASNMSKLGPDGRPIYRADGKIAKGPNYRPPNLVDILFDAGLPVKVTATAAAA